MAFFSARAFFRNGSAGVAIAGALAATPAVSQSAQPVVEPSSSPAAHPPADDPTGLSDIVVTARRTAENLQRVPVAASVLTTAALERQKVNIASDLQYNVPSLVITPEPLAGSSTPIFTIRGIGQALGTDNTVVTYFADVPFDSRVIAAGIYDLSSVQILRGPQGTLFGKNSTGGAVLFTPHTASTTDVTGFLSGSVGNYSFYQATGAVNIPLVKDVLGLRVSGQITRQDGFVRNLGGPDGNDKHYEGARAVLTFTPNDTIKNDLVVSYFHADQHNNPGIVAALGGAALVYPDFFGAGNVALVESQFARQQQLGRRTIDQSFDTNPDKNKSIFGSNTTSVELGDVTLKNILGYGYSKTRNGMNQANLDYPLVDSVFNRRLKQFSEEIQLSGQSINDSLKWIVGGFYSYSRQSYVNTYYLFNPFIPNVAQSRDIFRSRAIFGQATIDLGAVGLNGLKLTAGLRRTWDSRAGSQLPAVPVPLTFRRGANSWTLGLDYQVNPNVLVYVASRHSYKAGGFNLLDPATPIEIRVYKPETLTDLEVGVKAQFDVGTVPVRTNIAAYRGWYKNIHTFTAASCGATPTVASVVNAGKGSPKGIELEMQVRPIRNLDVSAFYNHTLGRYDSFVLPAVNGCAFAAPSGLLTGQNFGNLIKDTAGATVTYKIPLKNAGENLSITGNVYYRGPREGNSLSSFASPLPSYALLNGRIDYVSVGGSNFDAGVYVKNITNKLYPVERNNSLSQGGYDIYYYGDPRTFGIDLKYHF